VPCTTIAQELGFVTAKNVVALGALCEASQLFPRETYLAAIRQALGRKPELVALNERAFAAGAGSVEPVQEHEPQHA
jgi:Pyruvate/2-oxoacid:ferredoxin oxidoreductase gamma subunit